MAAASAVLAASMGAMVLAGWAFDQPILTRFVATRSAMQPLTALCAILCAASLVAFSHFRAFRTGGVIAAVVWLAALQALVQHLSGASFGLDHLLFATAVDAQTVRYVNPGRMAGPTATAFLLLTTALLVSQVRGRSAGRIVSACATSVLLVVMIALLSHLYAVSPLSGLLSFTQVSIPTAVALGGLAIGALTLRPDVGWIHLLIDDTVGAAVARWLAPAVILVPVAVAALAIRGSEAGLFPADFRLAFVTAVTIVSLAALALWGSLQLDNFVKERRSAEMVRENEATLRAFFDTEGLMASIIERRGEELRYVTANPAFSRSIGRDDVGGLAVKELVSGTAADEYLTQLRAIEASGVPLRMEQPLDIGDDVRWFSVTVSQIARGPSVAPRFATVYLDISEQKRAQAHQQLLLQELNHRVKNVLAIVQSLAHQSFRGGQAEPAALRAFESRLLAVASAHNLLVDQNWQSASLRGLVTSVAGPGCGADGARFDIQGPDLSLPPQIAVSLALALHELCTNAVKYGALSNEVGRVDIHWTMAESDPRRLTMTWTERKGPTVVAPSRRGFGSRLIERALAADLGGETRMEFRPEGLVCVITALFPDADH